MNLNMLEMNLRHANEGDMRETVRELVEFNFRLMETLRYTLSHLSFDQNFTADELEKLKKKMQEG